MTFATVSAFIRTSAGAVLVAATATCAREYTQGAGIAWAPGTASHTVVVGSNERQFLVHIPAARPRNRVGVPLNYPLVVLLHGSGANAETIRRQSRLLGMRTLLEDGLNKSLKGITTLEEVLSTCHHESSL